MAVPAAAWELGAKIPHRALLLDEAVDILNISGMRSPPKIQPSDLGHLPFGEVLRQLRKAAKVNQQEVAEIWEVSQSQVSDIERGRRLLLAEDRVRSFAKVARLNRSQTKQLLDRLDLEQRAHIPFAERVDSPFMDADAFMRWDEDTADPRKARELNALMARTGELLAIHGQQVAALQQTHTTLAATYTKLTEFLGSE